MKRYASLGLTIAVLAALVLGGLAWLRWIHDPAVRATAQLEMASDSLDRAVDTVRILVRTEPARDQRLHDSLAVLERIIAGTAVDRAAQRRAADSTAAALAAAVPDTLRPLVDSLQLLHAREVLAFETALRLERQARALLAVRLAEKDDLLQQVNAALEEAIRQRDRWRAQARPGFFERLGQALPFMAGTALAVVAAVTR